MSNYNTSNNNNDRKQGRRENSNRQPQRGNEANNASDRGFGKPPLRNSAMRDSLRPIRNQLPSLPVLTRLDLYGADGEDHINTEREAKTPLGRMLSIHDNTPFIHPEHGNFMNLIGFQSWLTDPNRDDAFRRKRSEQVHNHKRNNDRVNNAAGVRRPTVENLDYEMSLALWYKIRGNDKVLKALYDNELPFDCYYTMSVGVVTPIRQRPAYGIAYAQGLTIIQKAVQSGNEPTDLVMLARQRNRPLVIIPMAAVAPPEEKVEAKPVAEKPKKQPKGEKLVMQVNEETGVMAGQYDDGEINHESRSITGNSPVDTEAKPGAELPEGQRKFVQPYSIPLSPPAGFVSSVMDTKAETTPEAEHTPEEQLVKMSDVIQSVVMEGAEPDVQASETTNQDTTIANDDGSPIEVTGEATGTANSDSVGVGQDGENNQETSESSV